MDADALYARALSHHAAGRPEAALADCAAVLALRPACAEALHLRGVAFADLHRLEEALAGYGAALTYKPDYAEAHFNRGLALTTLGRFDAAIESFTAALQLAPGVADIHVGRGALLEKMGRYPEACADFDKALALDPGFAFLRGLRLMAKMRLADWREYAADAADIAERTARGEAAAPPLVVALYADSAAVQRKGAETWVNAQIARHAGPLPAQRPAERIRIGYFSMDFRVHPVALLSAGLFEAHDRARFEITAFSYGRDTGDALRQRLEKSFDRFVDVAGMSDVAAAAAARDLGLDIAVDLAGHTTDARPGILARRAAPLQVNYLGYPGTMAAGFMDYIVGDATVIPAAARGHYTEKVVFMPASYQVNDQRREVSPQTPTRADLGLPEEGFVFCCFNAVHKITPPVFDTWMRVLSRVPASVLWLLESHASATDNLRREAGARGVDPARLVFAPPAAPAAHLARQRAADLFLDTLPYNAHTTASDALWIGLPVLTCMGESFPARVAASLLHAVHLSELITPNLDAYEDLAVALAGDPARLQRLAGTLMRGTTELPLFDTRRYTRHLEAAYVEMVTRHRAGLAPDHITVAAS